MDTDPKKERKEPRPPRMNETVFPGSKGRPVFGMAPLTGDEVQVYLESTGSTAEGVALMKDKFRHLVIRVPGLGSRAALVLKQEMLSLGGEASISQEALRDLDLTGDVLLSGTHGQYRKLRQKLAAQPFGLSAVGGSIASLVGKTSSGYGLTYRPGGRKIRFPPVKVMGVLNVTPDSFSDGGKFHDVGRAVEHALRMVKEGADMIDVGGESTRPFSKPLTFNEERERVIPVIEGISRKSDCIISVDTYKSDVAAEALEAGAHIVNDVYAMRRDDDMAEIVKQHEAGVVLMHMKGTPSDMQVDPRYDDVTGEIFLFLKERADAALEAGIREDRIMVDPGIGFGKRLCDNLEIIKNAGAFSSLGYPVLVGPSRKGFIGQITGRPVTERLSGTVAAAAISAYAGAHVLRVHDVGEAIDGVRVAEAILRHVEHR